MIFKPEEISAVLTGLRCLQIAHQRFSGELPPDLQDIFDNAGTEIPLNLEEIEELCERFNALVKT